MKINKTDYEKYRWFFTSSEKIVIGGKNAEQNEQIMESVEKDDVILHTSAPGSPFCIIKNPNKKDIEEVAIFTACFSHEWKKHKNKSEVHIFRGEQVTKNKGMKTGTFGVMGSVETKKVELKLILDFQKGKIRALPPSVAKKKILTIIPGNLDKIQAANKITSFIKDKLNYPITRDEVMSALPSDNIGIVGLK
ncbi:MAG: NFACT RNA binding domain-containing protein [archaeon]|nr:NFACT RNA binding domain-containing protein [archaeon]